MPGDSLPYNPLLALATPLPTYRIDPSRAALIIMDMQNAYVDPRYGILAKAEAIGLPKEATAYYRERLPVAIANIRRLQEASRSRGMEVIFFKIVSLTPDGRDRGLNHRRLGIDIRPGSPEAEIVDDLRPLPSELVVQKTVSSPFNGTNIDFVLRNMGLNQLVVTGVVTNGCVETVVRDAADRGYEMILVEDACAAMTREIHERSVSILKDDFTNVRTTNEVVEELKALGARGG